ncbi:glutaredoxin domain-containing protein [Haloechinothrix halophila]|uniref:Glutaredoxin-like protein n=1 Tax=Haloechinothrix halophila YIM 93223 TaxID=592678 RepID=W9DN57_9PSEU|nr:glutaredoxin domain-containing protein [Haloechinothrix halophila]ETA66285.1 glutaredoxin-like protein [Haloechinothrix halophila YIM 93223]
MTTDDTTAVDFYWRPGCPFCMMLRAKLLRVDLPVREINIWEAPDAADRVRSVAGGNETVPTVFIGEHALVNPSLKELLSAVRTHAPEIAPPEPERTGLRRWLPWSR